MNAVVLPIAVSTAFFLTFVHLFVHRSKFVFGVFILFVIASVVYVTVEHPIEDSLPGLEPTEENMSKIRGYVVKLAQCHAGMIPCIVLGIIFLHFDFHYWGLEENRVRDDESDLEKSSYIAMGTKQ